MNRRQIMQAALLGGAAKAVVGQPAAGTELWVHPAKGDDGAPGTRSAPLKTLAEATRRVNRSEGVGPVTIYLSEGIYSISETTLLRPERRKFTKEARLTIRAEVLPDEPEWDTGWMPALVHTMPLPESWNGRRDPLGGAADGMLVETSHITVRGRKFLGYPVVETPKPGQIRRLYGISRFRRDWEDLEITQCMLLGDDLTNPLHVVVIAHGNGVRVRHCVFRELKISVVYWSAGSQRHAMTHCFCDSIYGSAVWTENVQNDFDYRNNIVSNCNYVWTQSRTLTTDEARKRGGGVQFKRYRAVDCYFAGNQKLVGSGTGARQQYADLDPSLLESVGTWVVEQPVLVERDQAKRNWLHPVAGSEAARLSAGLFLNPEKS